MTTRERRRYEHVPFSMELTIVDLQDNRRYKGRSINLSLGGIGFYAERFFEVGSRLTILAQPGHSRDQRVRPITVTVRWSRVEAEGAVMGAEFSQLLSPAVHPELYESLCSR
jgi:c-di-GMP-binding flagellar brake protein YcgR